MSADAQATRPAPQRTRVSDPSIVEFVVEQGVRFVTTSAGDPTRYTAAAFALGAEGVQMGTRMGSAAESPVHENWKNAIVAARETDTVFLNRFSKPGLRALRTERTTQLEREENVGMDQFGTAMDLYFGGDMEASLALGGQVMGRIDEVLPVRQIIESTVTEFRECARAMAAFADDR